MSKLTAEHIQFINLEAATIDTEPCILFQVHDKEAVDAFKEARENAFLFEPYMTTTPFAHSLRFEYISLAEYASFEAGDEGLVITRSKSKSSTPFHLSFSLAEAVLTYIFEADGSLMVDIYRRLTGIIPTNEQLDAFIGQASGSVDEEEYPVRSCGM